MTDQTQPLTPAPGFQGAADPAQMAPATVPVPAVIEDTVAMPVIPAPAVYATFGDMLAATMPGFDIWPCGRCLKPFTGAPAGILREDRVLWLLVELARDAGWGADQYGIWCCPSCLDAAEQIPAVGGDWIADEALHQHQRILHEFDLKARSVMTAGGRNEWDLDAWRCRWQARPEYGVPRAVAA